MAAVCFCLASWILTLLLLACRSHLGDCEVNRIRHTSGRAIRLSGDLKVLAGNDLFDEDGYMVDNPQERPDPAQLGGIDIQSEANRLAAQLRMLSNEEIGVTDMQGIFDSLPYTEIKPELQQKLDDIVEQMKTKLTNYLQTALKTNKLTVENLYPFHKRQAIYQRLDCCNLPGGDLQWSEKHQCRVTQQTTCDLVPDKIPPDVFNPGRNLTDVFQHNLQYLPSIKWQYFISVDRIYNEFPAHNYPDLAYVECRNKHDTRHRDLFLQCIHPQRKNIVIVVDHGTSLSASQLHTAKEVAKHLLYSLGPDDRVSVISLASEVGHLRQDECLSYRLTKLTFEAKLLYGDFIDKLQKQKTATNHSLGFEAAFDLLRHSEEEEDIELQDPMIVYISRGLLSSLTEAREVLTTIAVENGRLQNRVTINTYVVIEDGKPLMYEKAFLQDVADQNFQKYQIDKPYPGSILVGKMTTVNTTRDLSNTVGNFYKAFSWQAGKRPRLSLPARDEIGQGVIVSLTWPCYYDNILLGIVGLDVPLGDIVESATYFQQGKTTYAFVVDSQGYAIMHPSLKRPILSKVQPMHTDVIHLENYPGFEAVRQAILSTNNGEQVLELPRQFDNDTHPNQLLMQPSVTRIHYLWKHVEVDLLGGVPYVVVIKVVDNGFKFRDISSAHTPSMPQLVYHRLDLLPTDNTCMHLKQLATLESSALFLAGSAFINPFEHLSHEETKRMVQGYLAYLNDNTGLISNPGIKADIRKDVAAVSRINLTWLDRYQSGVLRENIIRRYVATPRGVFKIFPGTLMDKSYDPNRRDWYMRALEYPGKVTLTAPYLDAGGAGFIVTISHTIYEGKHAALHGPFDRVVAVMGLDMTVGYVYKMLTQNLPVCSKPNIRCFIMDDRGYVIAHRGLVEASGGDTLQQPHSGGWGPSEQKHITHMEPLVANDILNHKGFVRKKLCNSYDDRTIQRFYQFNTSLSGILTNLVHGEHCSRYQVTPIPGTNAFLGIVNQTCDMMRAFCPCSMVDRLCLNCHRMEQTECECPCECQLDMNFCTGGLLYKEDSNPSCVQAPEKVSLVQIGAKVSKALPQCIQPRCGDRTTKQDCQGIVDCEWCTYESDGITPLKEGFCSSQRVCFFGVLGSPTPYGDEVPANSPLRPDTVAFKSTPVGPVAGGIMGCFLVLALGVYCYRHHVHRQSHEYMTAMAENHLRMASMDNEPEELESPEDLGSSGHTNVIVLASFDQPSVSPYRMNTNYRRPTNAESDLGYSTMTPHEDSEQASTCIEPLIIGRDRYRPQTNAVTKTNGPMIPPPPSSRRSCSPTPPQTSLLPTSNQTAIMEQCTEADIPPPQTVLPTSSPPHRVLASVQVHMVDTH